MCYNIPMFCIAAIFVKYCSTDNRQLIDITYQLIYVVQAAHRGNHCEMGQFHDFCHKIPWLFQNPNIPWLNVKFPNSSLAFYKIPIYLTFPWSSAALFEKQSYRQECDIRIFSGSGHDIFSFLVGFCITAQFIYHRNPFLHYPRHSSTRFLTPWWRHQMETFSALLAICAGNSPVTGEFPAQRPVTRSFDVFFHLCLDKRMILWSAPE